jgi:hypothetical protein
MKTDRYTKVVLTLIAVGLVVQFHNLSSFPDLIIHHNGEIRTGLSLD